MDSQKRGRGRPAIIEVGAENNGSLTRRSLVNQMYQKAAVKKLNERRFSYSEAEAKEHFGGEVLEQLGRMILQDKCSDNAFSDIAGIVSKELFYKRATVKDAKAFLRAGRNDGWAHSYGLYWPGAETAEGKPSPFSKRGELCNDYNGRY
jgi:hypothetical protein